jgi:hypothetical protein
LDLFIGGRSILKDFDIILVQEVVAPPYDGNYPDGTNYNPDEQVTDFSVKCKMKELILSSEDSCPGDVNHINSSATEWWVAFPMDFWMRTEQIMSSMIEYHMHLPLILL